MLTVANLSAHPGAQQVRTRSCCCSMHQQQGTRCAPGNVGGLYVQLPGAGSWPFSARNSGNHHAIEFSRPVMHLLWLYSFHHTQPC